MSIATHTAPVNSEAPALSAGPAYLFESLVCDLHWSALHLGALASLIHAYSRSEPNWTLRAWRHLLNDNAQSVLLALRYHEQMGISAGVAAKIISVYQRLSELKRQVTPLAGTAKIATREHQALAHRLSQFARPLCADMVDAFMALDSDISRRLVKTYAADSKLLLPLLKRAASGSSEGVSPHGEISLPKLNQRRRTPRTAANQTCRVFLADSAASAVIQDVSREGLGLTCALPPALDQDVTIQLADGRELAGIIVRQNGEQIGISLSRPLPSTDPLFGF